MTVSLDVVFIRSICLIYRTTINRYSCFENYHLHKLFSGDYSSTATYTWSLSRTEITSIGQYLSKPINSSLSIPEHLQRSILIQSFSLESNTTYNISLTVVMVELPEV